MEILTELRLSTLGLAARAGKTVCGTQMVCEALKAGKAAAVFEASGNSANTAKRLSDRCGYYRVPLYLCPADAAALGAAVGKGPTAAVAVCDASFVRALIGNHTTASEKSPAKTV